MTHCPVAQASNPVLYLVSIQITALHYPQIPPDTHMPFITLPTMLSRPELVLVLSDHRSVLTNNFYYKKSADKRGAAKVLALLSSKCHKYLPSLSVGAPGRTLLAA